MKNIKLMKALTVFSAALVFQIFSATGAQAQAVPKCSTLTGGSIPAGGECLTTPTSLIFKIYELSLCTKPVTPTTSASEKAARCQTLFSSSTGKDVDLTPGSVFNLDAGLSLVEDTYRHGLLKIGTTFSMTTAHKFSQAYTSDDSGWTGAADSSGSFCYSNGNPINGWVETSSNKSQITCSTSAFSALPVDIIMKMFGDGGTSDRLSSFQMNTEIQVENTVGGLTAKSNLYILKNDSSLSTGDVTYAASAPRQPIVGASHDREYILADQTLANPVVITGNTKGLDVQFNVTDSASFNFASGKISEIAFNGLLFIFSAN